MSTATDLAEASIRIKRWAKAACEAGLVVGGANPEVTYSQLGPIGTRWRIYERLKWVIGMPEYPRNADGTFMAQTAWLDDHPEAIKESECCVAAAPTWGELLQKYALFARDPGRMAYFCERDMRGESNMRPPPDPPEWAEHRRAAVAAAQQAGERTADWVRKAAMGHMRHMGFDDAGKFGLAWDALERRGLVPK